MITGAAVSYVVQRARKSDGPIDDKTAASWALEGASMVVGRFISGRLTGIETRLAKMAEHGVHLRMKAAKLRTLARKVDETGDKDAAMQLLVDHHNLLTEEAKLLDTLHTVSNGKISRETIETLSAGNRFEREGVKGIASAALPLRLAGLTPDDASAKTWTGATEDISIALHQASLAGLSIRVLEHDAAAREWRVSFDNELITIVETPLRGRPRPAKADPSEADRKHAHRYADAADFMQAQWESMVKADIDARPVVEVDHLQVGYSIAGVMNQATLPEGVNKLVVYQDKGTLVGRGKQELGQGPKKWDAPGIRGSEQSPKDSQWITSEEHARSLDIGRLEAQTPAYRGSAVALEVRPKGPLGEDWKAPDRAIRVRVRDASGAERWFYTNRFDNAGGMGPGDLSQIKRVVDAKHLPGMLASGQLLRGEDPDYARKARTGTVFIAGSTPTGAWAAESAVGAGAKVDVFGDTRPPRSDWSTLTAEYGDLVAEVAKLPPGKVPAEMKQRLQQLQSLIASAHGGMALARNRKKGAAYEKGLGGTQGVEIHFGTPTKIEPGPNGAVLVTIGHGLDAQTMVYDQVVIAHGQDPSAPGAPGGLLGRGAALTSIDAQTKAKTYEEVPEGTIALQPIWSPVKDGSNERDLLGLESIDPPGIRLLGASYASKKLSPWVKQSERAAFEAAIDRMAAPAAPTRDHGPISEHSTGVTTGIERQRDHVPRANEVEATRFRLPGPERTLELDTDRSKWDDQVRDWFAIHLRADQQWVRVKRLGGGRSGAVVYRVTVGENEIGIFKIFDTKDGAKHEQEMLKLLAGAKLKKMKAVGERGRMSVDAKAKMGDVLLMDVAPGMSIKELVEHLPTDPVQRVKAIEQLGFAMKRTAEGLAEMHATFGSKSKSGAPTLMTKEAKLSDANYFLDNNFRGGRDSAKVKAALGDEFERVKAALEGPVLQGFLDARVAATAYHGDANAGNFIVHEYDPKKGFKDLGVIDVGSMKWSVEGRKGTKTGAADVARLLESLETVQQGKLTSGEIALLRDAFMKTYLANYRADAGYDLDTTNHALAEKWYRLEFEVAVLKSDPSAKNRILKVLEMEKSR
jgi:aminoglycoside phosphotransferase